MVCPNCHSKEIIAVQGQNFCISCGQLVPEGSAAPVSQPAAEAAPPATKPEEKRAKRAVGRPRKARLDTPITHLPPAVPPPPEPVKPPNGAVAVKTAPVKAPSIAPPKRRVMTDVMPSQPTAAAPKAAPAQPAKSITLPHSAPGLVKASLRALGRPLNYVQVLPAVIALGLPLAILWTNQSRLSGWRWQLDDAPQWAMVGQLALAVIILATLALIGIGAIVYGTARRHDKRGKSSGLLWAHLAAASSARLWGIGLWQLLIVVPTLAVLIMVVRYGSLDLALPPLASLAAVFLMAVAAGYLLLGAVISGLLATSAVMLGNVGVWRAVSLGWHGYRKHFELVSGLIIAKLLLGALAAALAVSLWPPALLDTSWLAWAGGGLGLVVLIGLVMTGGLAEAAYRHVISADRFGQAGSLLMGRTAKSVPKLAVFPLALSLVCAGGIAALQLLFLR